MTDTSSAAEWLAGAVEHPGITEVPETEETEELPLRRRRAPVTPESQRWSAIAATVQFSVNEWRDALPEGTPTDEWQIILWGSRRTGLDIIRAIQVMPREMPTAEDLERLNTMLAGIDKANLIKPGDENYPQRPQRR